MPLELNTELSQSGSELACLKDNLHIRTYLYSAIWFAMYYVVCRIEPFQVGRPSDGSWKEDRNRFVLMQQDWSGLGLDQPDPDGANGWQSLQYPVVLLQHGPNTLRVQSIMPTVVF